MRRSLSVLALLLALVATSPAVGQGRPSYARPHRLGVNLGFGFGSASMGRLHDLVNAVVVGAAGPKSGLQINGEISFRYYFPLHLLAQVGYGAIYNRASESYGGLGSVTNHNLVMEVPILIGGYHSLLGRLYLYGAAGPSIYFYPRSFFDPGTDLRANGGVGLQVLLGADFMAGENFAVGLELRFRYLRTGDLMYKDSVPININGKTYPADAPITEDMLLRNGSSATYNLDFTGITLGLNLRFFAL